LPEHQRPELAQLVGALDDRCEVVARQHSRLARELRWPVWQEDLHLADPAGVEQQLPRPRIAGRVLRPDPYVELAERDPAGLAAPAGMDQFALEWKQPPERGDRLRRRALLEARLEARAADLDLEHPRNLPRLRALL